MNGSCKFPSPGPPSTTPTIMFRPSLSLTFLLALVFLFVNVSSALGSPHHVPRIRHQRHIKRLATNPLIEKPVKQLRRRKSCDAHHRPGNTTSPTSTVKGAPGAGPSSPSPVPSTPASHKDGHGNALAPANWPTKTQAGAAPAATVTSPADPFLEGLSQACNNAGNALFTQVHTGQMTY